MAKGVGLDAGEYEIKVVELDGSFKRPRLSKVSVDRVSQETASAADEGHAAREAEVALHALKDSKVARDNVVLGFPCREAVLRTLVVPFRGVDQIRKVIKFEVEDSIHSHNVDDMVVDFQIIEEVENGTRVLVVAVPKQPLRVTLDALAAYGVDPETVDLDTMALYRAAHWAGCFEREVGTAVATDEDSDTSAIATRPMRIVMDVGGRSTRVLAVVDGKIEEMRALRIGVDAIAEEVAARSEIDLPTAREVVFRVFETGQDQPLSSSELAAEDGDDNEDEVAADDRQIVATGDGPVVTVVEITDLTKNLLRRIHRDLMRFVATLADVDRADAVFLTGGGSFLPGLQDVITDVFGVAPQPLPILDHLNHNLDDGEARWIEPRIAVAVGLALGTMGGVAPLQFRQEDLAFQRRFDRVKFPLAIACMLAVFLLFIVYMKQHNRVVELGHRYGATWKAEKVKRAGRRTPFVKAELYGYTGILVHDKSQHSVSRQLDRDEFQKLLNKVVDTDTFDRLPVIEKFLKNQLKAKREATGVYTDLQLPSGYFVLSSFGRVMEKVEKELGSFVILKIDLDIGAKTPTLEFKIAIRGAGYRARFDRLKSMFDAEFADPKSPFKAWDERRARGRGEQPFQSVDDPSLQGAINTVQIELKEPTL